MSEPAGCRRSVLIHYSEIGLKGGNRKFFERIFREARVDSRWYVNTGENPKQVKEKRKRAADTRQAIPIVSPNARFPLFVDPSIINIA